MISSAAAAQRAGCHAPAWQRQLQRDALQLNPAYDNTRMPRTSSCFALSSLHRGKRSISQLRWE